MRKPSPLPRDLAQRPFTLAQARQARLSARRTRAQDLWTPSKGIRVPRNADSGLLDRCRPYTTVTSRSVVSHITAAKIHGFYLPSRFDAVKTLDLSTPNGSAPPRRKHVAGHRLQLAASDVVVTGGVPVTSAARTLLDIAPLLTLDELVVIGDQLVCSHRRYNGRVQTAMVDIGVLNARVAQNAGARGMRRLRTAMELVRVGADSPPETRLRLIIHRSQLPNFEPNVMITDAAGDTLVEPDLACLEYKTCAEYDGGHHFSPMQQSKDHDRNFITESLGWHQAVINKDDMRFGKLIVVTKIARMLVRGGWPDPDNLAGQSLLGMLNTRKDFG